MTSVRQRVLDELQRRNYSTETTRGYILAIKQFAEHFGKSPEQSDTPRGAGGLMSWAVPKTASPWA